MKKAILNAVKEAVEKMELSLSELASDKTKLSDGQYVKTAINNVLYKLITQSSDITPELIDTMTDEIQDIEDTALERLNNNELMKALILNTAKEAAGTISEVVDHKTKLNCRQRVRLAVINALDKLKTNDSRVTDDLINAATNEIKEIEDNVINSLYDGYTF